MSGLQVSRVALLSLIRNDCEIIPTILKKTCMILQAFNREQEGEVRLCCGSRGGPKIAKNGTTLVRAD